jgi:HAD superfamily 5'-nucleotidase-like hydrolase
MKRSYAKKIKEREDGKAVKGPSKVKRGAANGKNGDNADGTARLMDTEPQPDAYKTQIFCNVELNGNSIDAVGFDMDFTLAQYNDAFNLIAFDGAKRNLVKNFGYPEEVMDIEYNENDFRRGLIIDKSRGNILKVDRHRYVRMAYHGMAKMSREERKDLYLSSVQTFTESNFVNIDTMFLIVDAALFAHIVDMKDKNPDLFNNKSYAQIYADIRSAVDVCHIDGVIKETVQNDPGKYIIYDENTVPMLLRLRNAGKKVFLLTNSMYEYTDRVMDYLVHGGGQYEDIHWQDLFDVSIVGAKKPAFLLDSYMSLFHVASDGRLQNIEDKESLSLENLRESGVQMCFQGGCWLDLHKMMDVQRGDNILYVGDHMYSDILRSKRSLGWRTCLVIPELEDELEVSLREKGLLKQVQNMRRLQYDLDEYCDILRQRLLLGSDVQEQLDEAAVKTQELKEALHELSEEYNAKFNPLWGQLFKAGHKESRFAKQVTDYVCLYTSKASNLRFVNPNRPFRPIPIDVIPHETAIDEPNKAF